MNEIELLNKKIHNRFEKKFNRIYNKIIKYPNGYTIQYIFYHYVYSIGVKSDVAIFYNEGRRRTFRKLRYNFQERKSRELKDAISKIISGEKEQILKTVTNIENYLL